MYVQQLRSMQCQLPFWRNVPVALEAKFLIRLLDALFVTRAPAPVTLA